MKLIRDYARGDILTIHQVDNTTVQGTFVRRTRRHVHLIRHKIEANGSLVECRSDRLLVPKHSVRLIEVTDA